MRFETHSRPVAPRSGRLCSSSNHAAHEPTHRKGGVVCLFGTLLAFDMLMPLASRLRLWQRGEVEMHTLKSLSMMGGARVVDCGAFAFWLLCGSGGERLFLLLWCCVRQRPNHQAFRRRRPGRKRPNERPATRLVFRALKLPSGLNPQNKAMYLYQLWSSQLRLQPLVLA